MTDSIGDLLNDHLFVDSCYPFNQVRGFRENHKT